MSAESPGPGQGSTFTVLLPRDLRGERSPSAPAEVRREGCDVRGAVTLKQARKETVYNRLNQYKGA